MGSFLEKPKTEKHNESGAGNGLRYGLSSMQGWRIEMEDAHCVRTELPGIPHWSFFAVFDGHAGSMVANHSSQELIRNIMNNEDFTDAKNADGTEPSLLSTIRGLTTGFLQLDKSLRQLQINSNEEDRSGSTAVCTLITQTNIFFANCGDSRAVLSRGGKVVFSTFDHKPSNPSEKERIEKAGGCVMLQRVNGSLAVSRALGDFDYKNAFGRGPTEQLVSPQPDISIEDRSSKDEFVILACDGIWDVMSNEELCNFVRQRMTVTDNLENICNQVIDVCLNKGSRDNMSIIIIALPGAPTVSTEALIKQQQLNALLESKIKELLKFCPKDGSQVERILCLLSTQDIEGLPPGGSIYALRSTVEEILSRLNAPSMKLSTPLSTSPTSISTAADGDAKL